MKKALLLLSLSFLTLSQVVAGNLKTVYSGKNFPLARQVTLNCKDLSPDDNSKLRDIITKNGGTVLYKFSVKSLIGPTVSVKHSKIIKGSSDRNAFLIEVNQTSVKITYSSPTSLENAIETLKGLVVTDANGDKCIKGGKYTWINDSKKTEGNTKKSHMAGEIKLLLSSLDKMSSGTETELILVTPTDWMIESPILEEFDNERKLYSSTNGYVSCDELKDAVSKAFARGVNLKIILQLNQENIPFKEVTGHSIFSPEGMRFLRAALEQWHNLCGVSTVYVGQFSTSDMTSERFNYFLETISPLIGIKICH